MAEEIATSAVVDEAVRDLTAAAATDAIVGRAKYGVAAVEDAFEGEQRTAKE